MQNQKDKVNGENGTATTIAMLIMMLLMGFVTLALTRSANETMAVSNEIAETRTLFAAQASVENMALAADVRFENKLSLDSGDVTAIQTSQPSGYDGYDFVQTAEKVRNAETVDATGQQFQGLKMLRDEWQVKTTATDKQSGVKVSLRRRFFDNRIPIFQFGIFYEDDLEFHPGPRFDFGGRVHSNGNLFLMAGTGLYFSSRVSAVGEVFTDVARNGRPGTQWGSNVYIKNGASANVQLTNTMGSVLKNTVNGSPVFASNPDMPIVYKNAAWDTNKALFQGNLLAREKPLNLPLKRDKTAGANADYIDIIKRGKNIGDLYNKEGLVAPVTTPDSVITSRERYANKAGIRISLADSKAKLPGCASGVGTIAVTTACGIRLDGNATGDGTEPNSGEARGYQPIPMITSTEAYSTTRLNGERFHISGREVWIKIELVKINSVNSAIETSDVTADILSLGITEKALPVVVSGNTKFAINGYGNRDSRSVVKLQRFNITGVPILATDSNHMTSFNAWSGNVVIAERDITDAPAIQDNGFNDNVAHKYAAVVDNSSKSRKVVPFPIQMFDTREGLYNDSIDTAATYGTDVPWAGVMSLIDIDVANLRSFLKGDFNSFMPSGTAYANAKGQRLQHTDVPQSNGWVLYVSDRRGDGDFDGEYDMEDIYGNNNANKEPGEDVNNSGFLDADYSNEAVRYTGNANKVSPAYAATVDHSYYRRGVRLINGTTLPGIYDASNSLNTRGFTVASENGVYVRGNYNSTGLSTSAAGSPTESKYYLPQNTAEHIPASIVSDAITILSTNWTDATSFRYPFSLSSRASATTTVRFAMISGDTRSSFEGSPNQGGDDIRLSGGVHNFKRFLESWGTNLNYAGSIINLFNSRNNNGAFKCCRNVYDPPERNWVFDATFLDPTRLPPGTPFLQTITLTGFERINDD